MRITHRRKKEEPKKAYRSNEGISAPEILVLGVDGKSLGIMKTGEAVRMARELGLDLVEINPKINPPVGKIVDYGQFRYQQEKEARIAKAHQHIVEIKGIRLSPRIGAHDLDIRKTQSIKFLNDGNKVKVELMMRGREMQQAALSVELVKNFVKTIEAVVAIRWEQHVERAANKVTAIIAKA